MANIMNAPLTKYGAKGNWVQTLQQMLINVGIALPKYGVDGNFGTETRNAVMQFQRAAGISVDGDVGDNTWNALYQAQTQGLKVKPTPIPTAAGVPSILPAGGLPAILGGINWTTIGIIAAIGFAIFMMFSKGGLEPERERSKRRKRR